ncbi:MAG TPA: ATP-binding cassette domain-containing protein [Terriglobia bacterium]|nr:ATP-binding cassette domain-containing protein [Terriglobia bacterium]
MENSVAISVNNVVKRFDTVTAVNGLSLNIPKGAIFGLLGPNGAGKTTTLRMILRIMLPDEGSIELLGRPLTDDSQDLIGYLPEERGLYTRMKVREVLVFLAALKGLSEADARRRVDEWLERFELTSWASNKVIDLSKGMQQKVQFIVAVIHQPAVLILDEPFTGLDPVNAALVKDIMLDLSRKGTTIILSTHRMEQVEMMCHSICLINKGESVLEGELAAIKRSYGKNTVRIEFSGDGDFLNQPGLIARVNHFGAVTEARLEAGADPQELLKAAVARGVRINRFELVEPPLNDIFIEKVGGSHA